MGQQFELMFRNVLGTYDALWDLGGKIAMNPAIGDHDNWLLNYRDGLRGMLARLLAVDRHYVLLHEYQEREETAQGNPNEWAVECDYHAGVILFGMDSSLECFIFALNALGFAKAPQEFCDITDQKSLKQIGPQNILGPKDPSDKRNPKPGYQRQFPRVVALWNENDSLLSRIIDYHDVSKHRSAVITGGRLGELSIRDSPKQPGFLISSTTHTLQSLAQEYQSFVDELLPIVLEESAAAFGYTATQKRLGQI